MRNTSFIPVENLHRCERKPQQRCCNHHCSPIYSIRRVPGKGYALLSKPQQLPSCYKRKIWPLSFLTIYIAFASRLTVSRIPLSNLVVSGDSTETQQTTVLRVAPEDAGCLIFEKGTAEWAWFLGTDFVGTQHSSLNCHNIDTICLAGGLIIQLPITNEGFVGFGDSDLHTGIVVQDSLGP